MSNVDQAIVWAGLINAILILALVLMFKDWPKKSSRHSKK